MTPELSDAGYIQMFSRMRVQPAVRASRTGARRRAGPWPSATSAYLGSTIIFSTANVANAKPIALKKNKNDRKSSAC